MLLKHLQYTHQALPTAVYTAPLYENTALNCFALMKWFLGRIIYEQYVESAKLINLLLYNARFLSCFYDSNQYS